MEKAIQILSAFVDKRLAIGVSGGIDSMSLLHLILNCSKIRKEDIFVVHIDHNLRESSKRDSKLVQDFCLKNEVMCEVFSADILSLAKKNKRSIETEARIFRQKVFKDFCKKNKAELVLAHNADDQAETVLMHIFRGSGISGLKGMTDSKIIRPFLYVLKKDIILYAKDNGVPYFEDETNADLYYSRNLIRNLFKQIETKYEKAKENILRLSNISLRTESYLLSQLKNSYFLLENGAVLLKIDALDDFLAEYYVMEAIKKAGINCDLEYKHIRAVVELKDKDSGKKINLIHSLIASREREYISFYIEKEKSDKLSTPFRLGKNKFSDLIINAFKVENSLKKGDIIVDYDKLGDCEIRFRRDGDKFTPCNGRTKKLKQYLNEKHIPNRLKDSIPLICKGDEVLVIVGYQLSDKVKLTESTFNPIKIEIDYGKN